MEPVF